MTKAAPAALAALLLTALTACGSGSSGASDEPKLSKDEKTAVASMEKAFTSSTTGALTSKEASCVSTRFVHTVGLAKLKSAKLLTASNEIDTTSTPTFDTDTSGKFADALLGCVDYQKRLAADTAKSTPNLDEAKLEACLEKNLPDSLVKKMLIAQQTQSKDAATISEQGTKAMTDCKADATK
jgi:hypothetical protein